jgi:MSHA pilin protein MshA
MKRNQQGFTLIELIVVIVILGVLAVTASPKFADLTGDAKAGTLGGVKTAIVGAMNIENSRSLIAGGSGSYPSVDPASGTSIVGALDLDSTWVIKYDKALNQTVEATDEVRIYPEGYATNAVGDVYEDTDGCYVSYKADGNDADSKPDIFVDENC